jgi:molybdenum cofactor biosynthesis enzyme MoaA
MPKIKKLKGLYCLRPFTDIDITYYNITSSCCESWLPDFNAGDIEKRTLMEIWNSELILRHRRSVLDGSYRYCSKERCPFLLSEDHQLFTQDELQAVLDADERELELEPPLKRIRQFAPWIRYILERKVRLDILPANYNLGYDETCNLRCPSCRSQNIVHTQGKEYIRRLKIHQKVFKEIEKNGFERVRNFVVSGAGDPFLSRIFQELLFKFDGTKYPLLKFMIMTNGVLLTPETWEKMSKIHANIDNIFISIDAATPETYRKIRINGDFERLVKNIEFLGRKRKENKLNQLILALVVQKNNYKEMADVVAIAKKYHVDRVNFSSLDNWESWELEQYYANAVCNPRHPEYRQLLQVLRNPVFDDPVVVLGNISNHRIKALTS